jgi:imidazolonepropionase
MSELDIIPHGAVLIRDCVIDQLGPTRRVENLAKAKNAREINAAGRIVMPAFVDPDICLAVSPLGLTSRKRLEAMASAGAAERARYGCLTAGAHTDGAANLADIVKVLRVHKSLQLRPLRLRSIFSPRIAIPDPVSSAAALEELTVQWLPAVRKNKLAMVVEFEVGGANPALEAATIHKAAVAAAGMDYSIRLRSAHYVTPEAIELALSAGVISIVAPAAGLRNYHSAYAAAGGVHVIPASEGFDDARDAAADLRAAINQGAAIAMASSFRERGPSSFNPQFLLYLGVYQLGLTIEEAITAVTWNAACSLRMSRAAGSLEREKSADLLVMDVPDYRELPRRAGHHDIRLVMRAGRLLARTPSLTAD